jgi:hypothetical protein
MRSLLFLFNLSASKFLHSFRVQKFFFQSQMLYHLKFSFLLIFFASSWKIILTALCFVWGGMVQILIFPNWGLHSDRPKNLMFSLDFYTHKYKTKCVSHLDDRLIHLELNCWKKQVLSISLWNLDLVLLICIYPRYQNLSVQIS